MTGDGSEPYESVLIRVSNAVCTDDDYVSNYYMWTVNDGSGEMKVHNTSIFVYEPVENDAYDITGPLNYDFDEWKIELRFESDVMDGTDFIPPTIVSVETVSNTKIKIVFSENIEETGAETIGNYSIDNGVVVLEAEQHAIQHSWVYLTVSEMETNDYILTIENVEDLAGNVIEEGEAGFTHVMGINDLFAEANISIYPNPASSYFTLNIPALNNLDSELILTISSLTGQTIIKRQFAVQNSGSNFEINTSMLDKGMYIIKINSGDSYGVQKLLIK
jgi:hypothetical protein